MNKIAVLILTLAMLLSACAALPEVPATSSPAENSSVPTTMPTEPVTEPITEPTTEPTEPEHSALYLPQYDQEKMFEYFAEVVLDVEYSQGNGNPTLVQKWLSPLYYQYYGNPTEEDKAVLAAFFAELNAVPGFPGIHPAPNEEEVTLSIYFTDKKNLQDLFDSVVNGEDVNGATQFWYWLGNNEIYQGRIGYLNSLDQATRNSILLEEIINTLGITDTILRPDSIVYQYSDDNLQMSDVDWVIFRILYDGRIQCGMNREECWEVFCQLYY